MASVAEERLTCWPSSHSSAASALPSGSDSECGARAAVTTAQVGGSGAASTMKEI